MTCCRRFDAQSLEVLAAAPRVLAGAVRAVDRAGATRSAPPTSALLVRHTIRAVTNRAGMRCSFAPALVAGGVGNGCHIHTSLWRDGENLMGRRRRAARADRRRARRSSPACSEGLPALLAVGAPSVASYLRLIPQRWSAPYRVGGVRTARRACGWWPSVGASAPMSRSSASTRAPTRTCWSAPCSRSASPAIERGLRLPAEVTVDPATLSADELAAAGVARLPRRCTSRGALPSRCEALAEAMGGSLFGTIHRRARGRARPLRRTPRRTRSSPRRASATDRGRCADRPPLPRGHARGRLTGPRSSCS